MSTWQGRKTGEYHKNWRTGERCWSCSQQLALQPALSCESPPLFTTTHGHNKCSRTLSGSHFDLYQASVCEKILGKRFREVNAYSLSIPLNNGSVVQQKMPCMCLYLCVVFLCVCNAKRHAWIAARACVGVCCYRLQIKHQTHRGGRSFSLKHVKRGKRYPGKSVNLLPRADSWGGSIIRLSGV